MLPSHELVDEIYNELARAVELHIAAAHLKSNIDAQLKILQELAIRDEEIKGKTVAARDAAWIEYVQDYLGPHAYRWLTDDLAIWEKDTRERKAIASINVERIRLHVRIHENNQSPPDIRYDPTGFEDAYSH